MAGGRSRGFAASRIDKAALKQESSTTLCFLTEMTRSILQRLQCWALIWLLAGSPLFAVDTGKSSAKFELVGEVRLAQPQKPRRLVAYVALNGNTMPYSAHTWTDFGGKF